MFTRLFDSIFVKYIKRFKTDTWVIDESYKFEFANFINSNVDWNNQTDDEILNILQKSQKIKYTGNPRPTGIQFIQKSGRKKLSEYIKIQDVLLFREFGKAHITDINWETRTMSYPGLSAWLSSLYPKKIFPVPQTGFNESITYLFGVNDENAPKNDLKYILYCQPFMEETQVRLQKYPFEDLLLPEWNKFYEAHPDLNIKSKAELSLLDWRWLTQDFHLFVLEYLSADSTKIKISASTNIEINMTANEGSASVVKHKRYERNNKFIQKVKESSFKRNKFLNCEVCGFSFWEVYGDLGFGFIEAHHKKPLGERSGKETTKASDIALICSNCHKMIHKRYPALQIDDLKKMLNTK